MDCKACVFVDGENLRHSLIDVFRDDSLLHPDQYLPHDARWTDFFDWIVSAAATDNCRRLRTYWFVTEAIDCHPYGLTQLSDAANVARVTAALRRRDHVQHQLKGLNDIERADRIQRITADLQKSQLQIESKFHQWISIQNGIAIKERAIEFRRAGAISFDLIDRRFGRDKAVDVRLACDMLMLRESYDTAIIISGDQDYVPAAQILKDSGKTVINVAFQRRSGKMLPGGARRLNIVTDSSLIVPYNTLRAYMGFAPSKFEPDQKAA
jgi:uncharacterized LabA/DUF88 family protein